MFLAYRCVIVRCHSYFSNLTTGRSALRLTKGKLVYSALVLSVAAWVTGITYGTYAWTEHRKSSQAPGLSG